MRGKLGNDNVKTRVSNNFAVKENNKYIGSWRVIVDLEIFLKVAKTMPFFCMLMARIALSRDVIKKKEARISR